ncbi:TlpA family protein disulfide reductase [Dethiothermospora halolimnae]|uniref:TlpA family protein disulfide reductase n=1 Tax=Dethiothermospora halolimnae TaxID=3114390 RepID=UPI003CCBAA99
MKKIYIILMVLAIGILTIGCSEEDNIKDKNKNIETNDDNAKNNEEDTSEEEKEGEDEFPNITIGEEAPDFTLENLDGDLVSLSDHEGEIVFINFWASWCPPCKEEMPDINKLYLEKKDDNFTVLAVNSGEEKSTASKFIKEGEYEFPVLLDIDQDISIRYLVTGLPKTVIVDGEGMIRYVKIGIMNYPEMKEIVKFIEEN